MMKQPLELIREMEQDKRDRHIEPTHVLFIDLQHRVINDLKSEINELVSAGFVQHGKTVNDIYLKTKK